VPLLTLVDFEAVCLGDQLLWAVHRVRQPNLLEGVDQDPAPSALGLRRVEICRFEPVQAPDSLYSMAFDIIILAKLRLTTVFRVWLVHVSPFTLFLNL
jgi:hypothetical protein